MWGVVVGWTIYQCDVLSDAAEGGAMSYIELCQPTPNGGRQWHSNRLLPCEGGGNMPRYHSWLNQVNPAVAISRHMAVFLVMLASLLVTIPASAADEAQNARQLVEKSQLTIESFATDTNMGAVRDLMRTARGVFIAPQVLKGAFILGASGGSGVFLARQEQSNKWSQPAFYTIGGVSFGLQAGGEASEIVLLVMTERGVSAMLGSTFKLGADASIAVGPVGAGAGGATAALSADIISFSRAQGLYGGISVDGSVVAVRDQWNSAYYGKSVDPNDILVRGAVSNPHSAGLIAAVTKIAGAR
jgi:lipid-binding SYLF domain-containing protein